MDLSKVIPCKGEMEDGGEDQEDAAAAAAEKDGKPSDVAASPPPAVAAPPGPEPKYWECMRNHAAALGLHASDGCGEFIPAGKPGGIDAYRCAACGCHRNFHRRDHGGGGVNGVPSTHLMAPYQQHPHLHSAAAVPSGPSSSKLQYSFFLHHPPPLASFPGHGYRSGGSSTPPPRSPPPPATAPDDGVAPRRRRCRTMFTREQKEEMRKFADKVGWSIQRHDGEELREFCARVGVRRHVLKVWMHNNKGTLSSGIGAGSSGPSKSDPSMASPI